MPAALQTVCAYAGWYRRRVDIGREHRSDMVALHLDDDQATVRQPLSELQRIAMPFQPLRSAHVDDRSPSYARGLWIFIAPCMVSRTRRRTGGSAVVPGPNGGG
jgi:hypothetical protein